jgi:uncharacterized membrane protein YjfL (UPF0719 family)
MMPLGQGLQPWDWEGLLWNVVQALVYVTVGFAFFGLAYFIIDKLTPFSFRKELIDEKNVALAVLLGSVFVGIGLILAASFL